MDHFRSPFARGFHSLRPEGFIVPCQPVLACHAPAHEAWIHKIEYDGYRLIARKDGDEVQLWTQTATNWTSRLRGIAAGMRLFPHESITLDGEAVVLLPDGQRDFHDLRTIYGQERAVMVAFDLLMLDGADLRGLPASPRERLESVLPPAAGPIQLERNKPPGHAALGVIWTS